MIPEKIVKHQKNKLLAKIILAVVVSMVCLVVIEVFLQIIYGNRKPALRGTPHSP
jgi:hypothetical protein